MAHTRRDMSSHTVAILLHPPSFSTSHSFLFLPSWASAFTGAAMRGMQHATESSKWQWKAHRPSGPEIPGEETEKDKCQHEYAIVIGQEWGVGPRPLVDHPLRAMAASGAMLFSPADAADVAMLPPSQRAQRYFFFSSFAGNDCHHAAPFSWCFSQRLALPSLSFSIERRHA